MTDGEKRRKREGLKRITDVIDRYAMEPMDRAAVITAYLEAWRDAEERMTDERQFRIQN